MFTLSQLTEIKRLVYSQTLNKAGGGKVQLLIFITEPEQPVRIMSVAWLIPFFRRSLSRASRILSPLLETFCGYTCMHIELVRLTISPVVDLCAIVLIRLFPRQKQGVTKSFIWYKALNVVVLSHFGRLTEMVTHQQNLTITITTSDVLWYII